MEGKPMGQATPFRPIAVVVEDDEMQRELVALVLEESEMGVIQCESAEAALDVLEKLGPAISMLYTDIELSGRIDGVELAHTASRLYPNIHTIVSSGSSVPKDLPKKALFMQKPWLTLDLLREAERARI
jgi:two-component system cell cycle response regulator CpdR